MSNITHELMTLGQTTQQRQLESQLLRRFDEEFANWRQRKSKEAVRQLRSLPKRLRRDAKKEILELRKPDRRRTRENRDLLDFLLLSIVQDLRELEELKVTNRNFRQTFSLSVSRDEQKRILLEYAKTLGRSRTDLNGDAKAVDRHLGEAAMNQRCGRHVGETEQFVEYKLKRLGFVFRQTLDLMDLSDQSVAGLWQRLRMETVIRDVLDHAGDVRLHRAALNTLNRCIDGMSNTVAMSALTEPLVDHVQALAESRAADIWMQTEAIRLLSQCAPSRGDAVLRDRLTDIETGDDTFVRRAALRVLSQRLHESPELVEVFPVVAKDPSAFVRQELPTALFQAPTDVADYWFQHLLLDDEEPKVRAATLHAMLRAPRQWLIAERVMNLLSRSLQTERDEFVLRVALHACTQLLLQAPNDAGHAAAEHAERRQLEDFYGRRLLPQIRRLQATSESLPVRRWASLAAEQIWCELDRAARSLRAVLGPLARSIAVGKSKQIPASWLVENDVSTLGRVLAVLSQEDFGLDIRRRGFGYRLVRGPVFATRWWRILHEFFRPATDKRQAARHTIGRVSRGVLRAPSSILAEISQTKVPGEPLFIPDEGNWRPFLPLLDDFLSVLDISVWRGETVRFFSAQGVTEVTAPKTFLQRLRAAIRISWSFEGYAALRNWTSEDGNPPQRYLEALRKLGFTIRFRAHQDRWSQDAETVDQSVTQFFSPFMVLTLPQLGALGQRAYGRFVEYFSSVFENSLTELVIFAVALLCLFTCRLLASSLRIRRARNKIAISIGGWGTRGKSGTERLKAALIGSLGHSLVSKTTGCEAMFLRGETFGETREFPLFRPFDKATIWEHHNVLTMAGNMHTSVFLWECMALNPTYVEVLQRHWTQDDLATIVNAYPDHEDVQGPAGWNVASVIAEFAPHNAHVLTTEQQMMPILRTASQRVGSSIRQFGWLESGLLTEEVLDRFPYQEHPDNVALVLEMAKELGVESDFALREMADWLIADLGVLRTYPVAHRGTKRLEFTNGCSANERFGFLGNWQRSGFAAQDPGEEPGVQITTVVNNRADRVARSRVFAAILVNDVSVDQHVLIGGNLKGFLGFVWEAWDVRMDAFSLWTQSGPSPAERFKLLATEFRQATTEQHVKDAIGVMLRATADEALLVHWDAPSQLKQALEKHKLAPAVIEEIIQQQQWWRRSYQEYRSFVEVLEAATDAPQPDQDAKCRQLLKTWFHRKFVVIGNYHATGEQIIQELEKQTAPGFLNRIMGVQNIKGTGLDFVYRWQAWQHCYEACEAAVSSDPVAGSKGLAFLRSQRTFGQLCQHQVETTLRQLREDLSLRRRQDEMDLKCIASRLANSAIDDDGGLSAMAQPASKGLLERLVQLAENMLDLMDSVRRRRKADCIYRDLTHERISSEDAIVELRQINQQQKGGWLRELIRSTEPDEAPTPNVGVDSFEATTLAPRLAEEKDEAVPTTAS